MSTPGSAPPTGVVVPTKGGEAQPGSAVAATPMKGGMLLSPLPLGGGKRKSRKLTKKMLKMLKTNPKIMKKLAAMKGGEEQPAPIEGARRRKTRRGSRKSRSMFY
jgi:hypothetical protein